MEQNEIQHSNKKVILAAFGAVGMIVVFLILAYKFTGSGGEIAEDKAVEEERENIAKLFPTIIIQDNMKLYKNSKFSFSYPSDWQVTNINSLEEESGVAVKPIVDLGDNQVISVTVMNSGPDFAEEQQKYIDLGFTRSTIKIDGRNAIELSGTIPPNFSATESASPNVLQVKHIYLEQDDDGYFIKSIYVGGGEDQIVENLHLQIISSFDFL